MTQLYKKNGAVFIPAGITLEEIEERNKQIEKMKHCYNCKFNLKCNDIHCDDCEDYNKWEWEFA